MFKRIIRRIFKRWIHKSSPRPSESRFLYLSKTKTIKKKIPEDLGAHTPPVPINHRITHCSLFVGQVCKGIGVFCMVVSSTYSLYLSTLSGELLFIITRICSFLFSCRKPFPAALKSQSPPPSHFHLYFSPFQHVSKYLKLFVFLCLCY